MKPTPKVAAAGVGGAVATLLVWFLNLAGVQVPAEAAAALTTLTCALSGYLKT